MTEKELQERTQSFALRVIRLVRALESTNTGRIIGNQLLRSGTSVAANYRAVCRSKSIRDFINKLAIVIEESDETLFWLEMVIKSGLVREVLVQDLLSEADQITAIMVSSRNSVVKNLKSGNH